LPYLLPFVFYLVGATIGWKSNLYYIVSCYHIKNMTLMTHHLGWWWWKLLLPFWNVLGGQDEIMMQVNVFHQLTKTPSSPPHPWM
jgi:hypothetical protein